MIGNLLLTGKQLLTLKIEIYYNLFLLLLRIWSAIIASLQPLHILIYNNKTDSKRL